MRILFTLFCLLQIGLAGCTGARIQEPSGTYQRRAGLDFPFQTIWDGVTDSIHDLGFVAKEARPTDRPAYLSTNIRRVAGRATGTSDFGERIRVKVSPEGGGRWTLSVTAGNYVRVQGKGVWRWKESNRNLEEEFLAAFDRNVAREYAPKETSDARRP